MSSYLIREGQIQHVPLSEDSRCRLSDRCTAYKNLFGLCVSFIFSFGAFLGIINLQSSINSAGGLGLASDTTLFATFVLVGAFVPLYVRVLGNKLALVTGYIGYLVYTLSNYYPGWYTLIIGSVVLGIFYGPVWVGMYSHATVTAVKYSTALKESPENAIALFTGWVAAATKLSRISGSLVSSIVLWTVSEPNTMNTTTANHSSGISACDNTKATHLEKNYLYYVLVSLYLLYGVTGIMVTLFTIDTYEGENLRERLRQQNCQTLFLHPLKRIFAVLMSPNMMLILPLCFLDGLLLAFASGTFPEVFVSDCLGVKWIGIVLTVFGFIGTLCAVSSGRLVKFIPQYFLMYTALFATLCLTVTLLFWKREKSYYEIFTFSIILGGSEAVINATIPALLGVLFNDRKEPAFTLFQIGISVGQVLSFSTALSLSTANQLWILLGLAVASIFSYTILIIKKGDETCCFIRERNLILHLTDENTYSERKHLL